MGFLSNIPGLDTIGNRIFRIFLLIGILLGGIYSIGGAIIDLIVSMGLVSPAYWETPGLSMGTILALGAMVVLPILWGLAGYILGFLFSAFRAYPAKKRKDQKPQNLEN